MSLWPRAIYILSNYLKDDSVNWIRGVSRKHTLDTVKGSVDRLHVLLRIHSFDTEVLSEEFFLGWQLVQMEIRRAEHELNDYWKELFKNEYANSLLRVDLDHDKILSMDEEVSKKAGSTK